MKNLGLPLFLMVCVLACEGAGRLIAHEGHGTKKEAGNATAGGAGQIAEGLLLPAVEGPKPWSEKPVLGDPQRFTIAIMTDRTGGHRPGIWMKAVERVNWMRPDFVVSVGDLIEGYTEDEQEIAVQWREFLAFIEQLEMKFFFVAGNHDVTNPTLHHAWRERFGKEWYSFDYKGVHFVCLCSEDPVAQLGEEQLRWIREDLESSRDARWTLVFLHKPLWTIAERELAAGNADTTNWDRVEQLLVDRPHTVFAGHVHHYVQYQRNGQQYYSLATTGGASQLRGLSYGEFDHVTWLTMERDGPRVVNLLLDGIQPAEVVTEESFGAFRDFLAAVRCEVEPILIRGDALQYGEIKLRVSNQHTKPIHLEATIAGLPLVGLEMETQSLKLDVPAGDALIQTVPFRLKEPVALERFRMTELSAKITSTDSPEMRAEWTVPVIIDRELTVSPREVRVDGDLAEWEDAAWWESESAPAMVGNVDGWAGVEDGSFRFSMGFDARRVYFAIKVIDERVVSGDSFVVSVDPRLLQDRLTDPRLRSQTIAVRVAAPLSPEQAECEMSSIRGKLTNPKAWGRRVEGGYELEISVPINKLVNAQTDDWSSAQLGARMYDVDSEGEAATEILWRSAPELNSNREHAHVFRK